MAIDMSSVNKITIPESQITVYKKTFSFTNSNLYVKGTDTQGYIRLTVYSKSTPSENITTTNSSTLYNFLVSLGYNPDDTQGYINLSIDNPYECEFDNNGTRSVWATFNSRSSGTFLYFSVPEGTSTSGGTFDVTSTEWEFYFTTSDEVTKEYKYYLNPNNGTYTKFEITSDIFTGQEYIGNYLINNVSYPNVTISSVSGNDYTLSDGNTYNVSLQYNPSITLSPAVEEVFSILDITGNILWEKADAYGYYIKIGDYYISHYGSGSVRAASTTPLTVWHLEEDNRLYCLVDGTKRYLYSQTSGNFVVYDAPTITSSYTWLYKNGNYITATISGTKYYLYRYSSTSVRMHTPSTVITFESNDPRIHTPDWHTIWEGDYSITCEAINGQIVKQPESNMVVYHIPPKVSSIATSYSNMQIKVYYQFSWIGNRGTSTPANTYITEYTVSNLSSDKTILNLPVTPTDSTLSLTDFIASGVSWDSTTGNIEFECRGYLHPEDTEYLKTVIRITKIELYC